MKKITLLLASLFFLPALAQEHYSGITTSKRVGIINAGTNPSELANLSNPFEIQVLAVSVNASSNKVGFSDLINGSNLESLIFSGNESVDFSIDSEIYGPGFAMSWHDWGFAVTTKAHIKANVMDVDANLGDALTNAGISSLFQTTTINNNDNQRINATSWGEVGFSVARKVFENEKHKINAGVTFKLLFPGSYANIGAQQFRGTISNDAGTPYLSDAHASLNIAYSGSLANNFSNTSDYTSSIFGNLKGVATDIGMDYQLKDGDDGYKLKVGAAVKNIGSMTFKSDDNYSTNYVLNIPVATPLNPGLNLNAFNNADGVKDIENILLDSGYLNKTSAEKKDFKVKLPTVLNLYADLKVIPKLNVTVFLQQKLNEDNGNDQIASQNSFSIIPRFGILRYEVFAPVAFNEISGTTVGLGFRAGGFFIGSSSIITGAISDSNQADLYLGYRFGFL